MSALLIAAGCVFVGFVGGLIGRRAWASGSAVTPVAFEFRYEEVDAVGLQDQLLTERQKRDQMA